MGGNFTSYNGEPRNYLARLNADGSLDATFDPGTALNGPVNAIALQGATTINVSAVANGFAQENDNYVNLESPAGVLTVNYNFYVAPDDLKVFYGGTNGVLIYDTTLTNFSGGFTLAFGPTNGLTTNLFTLVMNQGGRAPRQMGLYGLDHGAGGEQYDRGRRFHVRRRGARAGSSRAAVCQRRV